MTTGLQQIILARHRNGRDVANMTMVEKTPLITFTRRRFKTIMVIVIILAAAVPITLYWAVQRNDMHHQWALQSSYALEFWSHTDYAAGLLNGNVAPWGNVTEGFTINELGYAAIQLYDISYLDTSHANQLLRISYAIETLKTQNYIHNMTSSQRISLSTQLELLSHKIINAYSNYANFTSTGTATGPPFWYTGPSPPDEQLLQDAVNIALGFQRK